MGRPETNDALVVEHLCDFEDHVGTDGVDAVPHQDTKVVNLAGLTSLKEYGAFRAKPGKSKDFKTTIPIQTHWIAFAVIRKHLEMGKPMKIYTLSQ